MLIDRFSLDCTLRLQNLHEFLGCHPVPALVRRAMPFRLWQKRPRSLIPELKHELGERRVPEIGVVIEGDLAEPVDIHDDLPLAHGLTMNQRTLDENLRYDLSV